MQGCILPHIFYLDNVSFARFVFSDIYLCNIGFSETSTELVLGGDYSEVCLPAAVDSFFLMGNEACESMGEEKQGRSVILLEMGTFFCVATAFLCVLFSAYL